MNDAPELFVEFREGGKICVWDFDNGSIPYVRKVLLDIAIARAEAAEAKLAEMVIAKDIHQLAAAITRAEAAERREKALLATNQERRDDLVLSTGLRRRAEKAEAGVARLRESLSRIIRTDIKGPRSLTEARWLARAALKGETND